MASAEYRARTWRTGLALFLLVSALVPAQAQKFEVLHAFHAGKGPLFPSGQLVRHSAGNLYGETSLGGSGKCGVYYGPGCGTAFKMDKSRKLLWVYSFDRTDGEQPEAGLLRDADANLYGTTVEGGKRTTACDGSSNLGCGFVFRLRRCWRKGNHRAPFHREPRRQESGVTADQGLSGKPLWHDAVGRC
jgi:hypothetical protein